jgi:Uma2 family endonuclease
MSAHAQPRLTPEQYLEIERAAEFKSDYYDGRMYAMSGGSYRHITAIGNLAFGLRSRLGPRCSVHTSDLRLQVSPSGLYTYPDVIVVCGEPRFVDRQNDNLLNPTVLAEVLSPSTEAYDRGFKSTQYRTIASLQEYALVWQFEPRVEVYQRQSGGRWLLTEFMGLDAVCRFESLDCTVALSDIYHNVSFQAEDDSSPAVPLRTRPLQPL